MKRVTLITAAALLVVAAVSCDKAGWEERMNPYKALDLSTKSAGFVEKGGNFTFNYIKHIDSESTGDYIISPLSMQFLLGMILDGARGETASQICEVLGYGAGEADAVDEYALSLLKQLPALDKKTKLRIANAIFVDDGWPLYADYKSTVGKYYQAEVANLDFSDNAASLKAVNGWCSRQTNKMIPKIMDSVDPDLFAILLNAMYFKSQWKEKFQKSSTAEETFTFASGSKGTVAMMKQSKNHLYTENDDFQAVKLPYGNGAYNMIVLLPKSGRALEDVIGWLINEDWQTFLHEMVSCRVDLWLPKFETKYSIELKDILSRMGMPLAFDEGKADFKAMSEYAGYLSRVKQDAIIKVDEEGTEAAVVSSGWMVKDAAAEPGSRVVFHADHPFLYLISESSTGVILFAGRFGGK